MPTGIYKHKLASKKTKKIMSKAHTGEKNAFYGKKHTKEAIEKNRLAHLGKNHYRWRGKEYQASTERWFIWINGIRCIRARYVAMKCLGRELVKGEEIHHINEDCSDDRPKNLYLFPSRSKHMRHHRLKNPPTLTSNLLGQLGIR